MPSGKVGLCGHMVNGPSFDSLEMLEDSDKLQSLRSQLSQNEWPQECIRCAIDEKNNTKSVRMHAMQRDMVLSKVRDDYLIVGGILDNICNAACQFCNEDLSTKIGALKNGAKGYKLTDNMREYQKFPKDRIIELDINGGEPSNSVNYRNLISDPPPNVKIIRINTNCNKYINVTHLLEKGIKVIITVSMDGTADLYEYVRYPLQWNKFIDVLGRYCKLREQYSELEINIWTTLSVYTLNSFQHMRVIAKAFDTEMSIGILQDPPVLAIQRNNWITNGALRNLTLGNEPWFKDIAVDNEDTSDELMQYIAAQDKIRRTDFTKVKHYFPFTD